MKKIPLTQGRFAIVDREDFSRLSKFKWCAALADPFTGRFVAVRRQAGRNLYMHHEILPMRAESEIDHRNLDGLDNRRRNLRRCTRRQNKCNSRLYRNNSLGIKGVTRNGRGFIARICVSPGRRKSLGTFKTIAEAGHAYNEAAKNYYGEFCRVNKE
jgi:hypothetical protein